MKNNLPIILIGTRDQGQASGISQMFELLIYKFTAEKYPFFVIDLTLGTPTKKAGSFSLLRGIRMLGAIVRYLLILTRAKTIYLTIGVSRLGFLRDAIILWPAILLRKKTIIHVHSGGYGDFYSSQSKIFKYMIKHTLEKLDHIIVLGNLLKDQFNFVKNSSTKIEVVKNALPTGLSPNVQNHKHLMEGEIIKVLYLSNMIESKGFLDVLEACRILRYEKHTPAIFDFCGGFRSHVSDTHKASIDSVQDFYSLVKKLGLEDIVNYHGIVSGIKKEKMLIESHILVLPTYYSPEGQPTCIIEALAYGNPVIATNFRGIHEEIIDYFNGYFVEPKSPGQIVSIISMIIENPDKYKRLSANALVYYSQNFTPTAHYKQILPILLGPENLLAE
jgi:glycosyltransferase involved in cell wall biosynthesis